MKCEIKSVGLKLNLKMMLNEEDISKLSLEEMLQLMAASTCSGEKAGCINPRSSLYGGTALVSNCLVH